MKRVLLTLSVCVLPVSAFAQAADPVDPPVEELEDVIIVEGQRRGADPAMDAWLRGDFKQAEIEFERNFSRLKQSVRLRETTIQQNVSDSIFTEIQSGANVGSGANAAAADASAGQTPGQAFVYTNQRREKPTDPNLISSGSDLGGQLYMAGLSELKLGKYDEARKSFERALFYNETLHDARLRLGLLALQDNDVEEARKQLAALERKLGNCHARCERFGDREILENGVTQLKQFLG